MEISLLYILDLIGTFAFAISGAMHSARKQLDAFGIFITAFLTALGGGTIRDFLLGRSPVGWMQDINYIIVVFIAVIVSFIAYRQLLKLSKTMFLFDAIGIGVFTIVGINIAMSYNINIVLSITMGMVSACFGGILRDIFLTQIPLILRKEIYATACLLGGVLYVLLEQVNVAQEFNMIITILFIIMIRVTAVKYHLSLPKIKLPADLPEEENN